MPYTEANLTVFLCTPHKHGDFNYELIRRIEQYGFQVLCAATHNPQNRSNKDIFVRNVELIQQSHIFVAVLKDYGKDLTWEVGMAYGQKIPTIGLNYNALETDVMTYYSLDKIVKPEELELTLKEFNKRIQYRMHRDG
jgi:nucleoside 2-deoxyribosyltransferase